MQSIDIYTHKLPPQPAPTPVLDACHQPGVYNVHHTTLAAQQGPNHNLSQILRTIVLLAIVAGCAWGGIPEVLAALLLRYLP